MQEYEKHIARWMISTVWVVSARKKTSVYILKPSWEVSHSFEESLRRVEVVKNLEILWMNNETIIELRFRLMWIMQI